jgi:hypothetical protein
MYAAAQKIIYHLFFSNLPFNYADNIARYFIFHINFDLFEIILLAFVFFSIGRAQKNAKHGADDKAKNLMEAMHEKMTLRESTRPHLFKTIR